MCNRVLRAEVATLPGEPTKVVRRERGRQNREVRNVAQDILSRLDYIYEHYWHVELLATQLDAYRSQQEFYQLHNDTDVIWIGEVYHSGIPYGEGHFRPVGDWRRIAVPWHFTCTGVFASPQNVYRTKSEVVGQNYCCLEFDRLDPDPLQNQLKSIALFFYLEEVFGLEGRIAINSGNKSIHFWVLNNPEIFTDDFRLLLKRLGGDPAGLRPYHPVRFPGVWRRETNRLQGAILL
jgi:hypothetical protein